MLAFIPQVPLPSRHHTPRLRPQAYPSVRSLPPYPRRSPHRATLAEQQQQEKKQQPSSLVSGGGVTPSADKFKNYDGVLFDHFHQLASAPDVRMVPLWTKIFADKLTPVLAFRCLLPDSDLHTPSFLLESVHNSQQTGRFSLIAAKPVLEVVAHANQLTRTDFHPSDPPSVSDHVVDDPWHYIRTLSDDFRPAIPSNLPGGSHVFNGGWVGFGGYDTVRYAEPKSLPFDSAPHDDRNLPDLHMGLYRDLILFDHVTKLIYVIHWVDLDQSQKSTPPDLQAIHQQAVQHLQHQVQRIISATPLTPLQPGLVSINTDAAADAAVCESNMTKEQFMHALSRIHHHLCVGDTFQTVFSQRFQRRSPVHPFDVYRALRIINPSPYMIYMQSQGCILVASSPEILTRVVDGVLTNRPLAGTRRRGTTPEEDEALAEDLLADEKDRSEHMMLVDLGRNDVGAVSEYGSVDPERVMDVERYSHVMHLSSTVTGTLREGLSSWDALRATLPAGTISGAPKIRAMQIIDDLEPTKRGPYGGGIGYISFNDSMNMALALRTMVIPTEPVVNENGVKEWVYYLQAGAGIVYESDPEAEYRETVNKAMALNRAIDLAESAFS